MEWDIYIIYIYMTLDDLCMFKCCFCKLDESMLFYHSCRSMSVHVVNPQGDDPKYQDGFPWEIPSGKLTVRP
jgi:hypothetical protein